MPLRSASLLAAAALAAVSVPAFGQEGRYDPGPPPPLPEFDEAWEREEEAGADYAYEEDYREGVYREEHRGRRDGRGAPMAHRGPPRYGPGPAFSYPPEQRAQWLEQCRASLYDQRGERRGQSIGGVLGAVAGGVAGNRIAGRGSRLGGTLIGAGVGGLAGAAIGGAVGRDADRDRIDECEDYLLGYERSLSAPAPAYLGGHSQGAVGYHYPYPYPVMWVKVPIHTERRGDCGCETVIEERIVEEAPPPPPRRIQRTKIRRVAAPPPVPGKRLRVTK